jgi:hypothetical protein
MSYELKFEHEEDPLRVKATGTRNLETVLAMIKDMYAECAESQLKKVLLDVRALKSCLDTLDAYEIPARYLPVMRNLSVVTHVAIVDLKKCEENNKFFENVAVNRGFMLRVFSDTKKAVEWLKQ